MARRSVDRLFSEQLRGSGVEAQLVPFAVRRDGHAGSGASLVRDSSFQAVILDSRTRSRFVRRA